MKRLFQVNPDRLGRLKPRGRRDPFSLLFALYVAISVAGAS
jgi:hypothetical protein